MKKMLTSLLLLIATISLAQTVSEINIVIGIPDSLINSSEIRIYKGYATTNGTEIFRVYNDGREYKAELYSYYHSVPDQIEKPSFTKTQLKGVSGNERAWMEITLSNIEHLPQWEMFEYKFKTPEILFYEGCYAYQTKSVAVLDGICYKVFYKNGIAKNYIEYGNPESYLRRFPGVDELEMFSQMLNTIKEEFGLWKD